MKPPRAQHWPWLAIALGAVALLPVGPVRAATAGLEDALVTLRGLLDPTTYRGGVAHASSSQGEVVVAAEVLELLARARGRVLPPSSAGWERGGRFAAIATGAAGTAASIELDATGPIPADEPVFVGRELIGFTAFGRRDEPFVRPLRAKGQRTPACAGVPGQREVRCLALGDGSESLRIAYADARLPLLEGDVVWAIDDERCAGALLGRVVRGDTPHGAEREEWRIAPLAPPDRLVEVAIRFPEGAPLPTDRAEHLVAARAAGGALVDPRRGALRLDAGFEAGVGRGDAVSSGGCLIGRVVRAGWRSSLVRTLRDPGFRCRVLLLRDGTLTAWELETSRDLGAVVELADAPPVELGEPPLDGTLVVTARAPDGTPEGLVLGSLRVAGGVARLELAVPSAESGRFVHRRPPGAELGR